MVQLIDPKGAVADDDLWTHPLNDDDFINNGRYRVGFSDANDLLLQLNLGGRSALKPVFVRELRARP